MFSVAFLGITILLANDVALFAYLIEKILRNDTKYIIIIQNYEKYGL